jgi:hypothetical protein
VRDVRRKETNVQDQTTFEGNSNNHRNDRNDCNDRDTSLSLQECEAIDVELRRIARLRAGQDADEAQWLRDAQLHQIWRQLGFSSAFEYLEDVFGYAPRTARERLRVASELGELPELEAALREGVLSYSAVRELSRVADPETQSAWVESARGRTLRTIELLVGRRKKGDRPGDPPSSEIKPRRLSYEVSPETFALLREAKNVLENEVGAFMEDEDFIHALCRAVIDGHETTSSDEPSRPAHQLAITICDECQRGWQDAAGVVVEIAPNAIERAECDAQLIGAIDDGVTGKRATTTIPRATRRKIWRRDHGRCQVPGCRAARNLDIHHVVHRADGGDHDLSNLVVMCSGHHKLLHDGLLTVKGVAPNLTFTRRGVWLGKSTDAPNRFAAVTLATGAKDALARLGIDREVARDAIAAAMAHVGHEATLEIVIREALFELEKNRRTAVATD